MSKLYRSTKFYHQKTEIKCDTEEKDLQSVEEKHAAVNTTKSAEAEHVLVKTQLLIKIFTMLKKINWLMVWRYLRDVLVLILSTKEITQQ